MRNLEFLLDMTERRFWTRLKNVIRYYKDLPKFSENPPSRIPAYATEVANLIRPIGEHSVSPSVRMGRQIDKATKKNSDKKIESADIQTFDRFLRLFCKSLMHSI